MDFHTEFGSGCEGRYEDTGEKYQGDECFIDGVKCVADEGHFGGTIIRVAGQKSPAHLKRSYGSLTWTFYFLVALAVVAVIYMLFNLGD